MQGEKWDGDVFIADQDEISSAERFSEIHIRRIMSKDIEPVQLGGKFSFALAGGNLSQTGGGGSTILERKAKLKR